VLTSVQVGQYNSWLLLLLLTLRPFNALHNKKKLKPATPQFDTTADRSAADSSSATSLFPPEQQAVAELSEGALLPDELAVRHCCHCRLQPRKVKGVHTCTHFKTTQPIACWRVAQDAMF
jgi:hypothetical protein